MAQKRKKKKTNIMKWVVRAFLLALFIAAVVIVFLVWDNYFNDKKEMTPKVEDESSVVDEKEETEKGEDEGEAEETPVVKEQVKQYEGGNPNESETLSGAITYAGVSAGVLRIRINIDQYLSGGNCELNLYKGGNSVYSAMAGIVDSASTSTCEGFDVPTSNLQSGTYQIEVKVTSGNKAGTISREVSI